MSGKGVMTAGKWQEGRFLPFLALPLMIKAMPEKRNTRAEKGVRWAGRAYSVDEMNKKF